MPTAPEYYRQRWKAAKVRYDLSYGMFHNETLVGFIINGIDKRSGNFIAFNTGTGVLPEYRGKRIVKAIYDHALPDLKKNGINKCSLEVIKDNKIAIKAYKRVGFSICKSYQCFSGKITPGHHTDFTLKELGYEDLDWNRLPNQDYYSWDHHKNSLREADYRYFQVIKDNIPQSYFVMNPANGYVSQFDLLQAGKTAWKRLFSGIRQVSESVKMNNIDERLDDKIQYIKAVGLTNTVDQYEMELCDF